MMDEDEDEGQERNMTNSNVDPSRCWVAAAGFPPSTPTLSSSLSR